MRRLRNSPNLVFSVASSRPAFGIFGKKGFLLICFLFLSLVSTAYAQNQTLSNYSFLEGRDLDRINVKWGDLFNFQSKADRIIIAVEVNSKGEIFVLTFGNGIQKVAADGTLQDFVSGSYFNSPMDFAINSEDKFYVAVNSTEGKNIKVFSPTGAALPTESFSNGDFGTGMNNFKGPVGLAFDSNDNLYVADHYIGSSSTSDPSRIKVYYNINGSYKNSQFLEFTSVEDTPLIFPFRIAVNNEGQIFVSDQGSDGKGRVLVIEIDGGTPKLVDVLAGAQDNIGAPGDIVIDQLGYIYIADLGPQLSLPVILTAGDDPYQLIDYFDIVKNGIRDEVFKIRVYDPQRQYQGYLLDQIDLPLDMSIDQCGQLYVNNLVLSGKKGTSWMLYTDLDANLDFDLEIYKRTPSADVTPPVALCTGSYTINLAAGETVTLDPKDLDDGSFDGCGGVTFSLSQTTFTEADDGANVIDFIVTDEQGLKSKCEVTIQVNVQGEPDTIKPVFTFCPESESFSASAGECRTTVDYTLPTVTDNSGAITPVLTKGPASGGFFPLGSTEVEYTATDPAGNTSTCSFIITVTDDEAPELKECPENAIFEVPFGEKSKVVSFKAPTALDECSDVTGSQTEGLPSGSNFPIGTTVNTFILKDGSGNEVTCSFTITVNEAGDTEDPIFQNCPGTLKFTAAPGNCGSVIDYVFPIATDNSGEVTVTKTGGPDPETFLTIGDHIVYFKAEDKAGNTATCQLKISVTDEEDPEFTSCPGNIVVELPVGDSDVPVLFPQPPASDNCSFQVTQTKGENSGSRFPVGTHEIEFTVTDNSGRTSTCNFTIIVNPAQTSPLEISCPNDQVLDLAGECSIDMPDYKKLISATEGATISQSPPAGTTISKPSTVTITAALNGESLTCDFDVELINSPALILYCLENHTVEPDANGNFALPDYTLQANVDGACGQLTYTQSPVKGTLINKDTTIILTARDERGMEDSCSFDVKVEGTEPPEIICKPATLVLDDNGNAKLVPEVLLDPDSVDSESIESVLVDKETFTCDDLGTQNVELTIRFKDGTSATCNSRITVLDDKKPVLSCILTASIRLNSFGVATVTADYLTQSVNDNCGPPTVSIDKASFTEADLGDNLVTVTAIDASGNEATCETTVTIKPYEGENTGGITCPEDAIIPLNEDGEVTVSIRYDGDADVKFELDKSFFTCDDIGLNTVNLTYTGDYEGTCTSQITIVDVTAPNVSCVGNYDLVLDQNGKANLSPEDIMVSSSDNCLIETISISKTQFSTADVGQQWVILTVTDSSGNKSECSTTVNVKPFAASEPIQCVSSIDLELDENGQAIINPHDLFSGGSGSGEYTISKEVFDCSDVGEQSIVFTYRTPSQEGSCNIVVRVSDPQNSCEVDPVEPPDNEIPIILYPNPGRGLFKVKTGSQVILERVEVFDMRGRFMCEQQLIEDPDSRGLYSVDIRGYQAAVYTLKFYSEDEVYIKRAILAPE